MNQPPPLPIDGASSSEEEQDLDLQQEIEFIPLDDEVLHDVVDASANEAEVGFIGFNGMDLVFHWPQLVAHLEK